MKNNLREAVTLILKTDYSNRRIAKLVGFSPNTIKRYRTMTAKKEFDLSYLEKMNDVELLNSFRNGRQLSHEKRMPDWPYIHKLMQQKHQTLIELWEEYRLVCPSDAYSYSQFTHYFRRHLNKVDLTMRQIHYAGDCVFVDYAGKTIE